mmetsp:Transcript_11667/g.37040  ORF Transcript_11667/g.37040 Transcript_11667/m.37040 type:complete len:241 (+) Transcript_11667:915-1637(+)
MPIGRRCQASGIRAHGAARERYSNVRDRHDRRLYRRSSNSLYHNRRGRPRGGAEDGHLGVRSPPGIVRVGIRIRHPRGDVPLVQQRQPDCGVRIFRHGCHRSSRGLVPLPGLPRGGVQKGVSAGAVLGPVPAGHRAHGHHPQRQHLRGAAADCRRARGRDVRLEQRRGGRPFGCSSGHPGPRDCAAVRDFLRRQKSRCVDHGYGPGGLCHQPRHLARAVPASNLPRRAGDQRPPEHSSRV